MKKFSRQLRVISPTKSSNPLRPKNPPKVSSPLRASIQFRVRIRKKLNPNLTTRQRRRQPLKLSLTELLWRQDFVETKQ